MKGERKWRVVGALAERRDGREVRPTNARVAWCRLQNFWRGPFFPCMGVWTLYPSTASWLQPEFASAQALAWRWAESESRLRRTVRKN